MDKARLAWNAAAALAAAAVVAAWCPREGLGGLRLAVAARPAARPTCQAVLDPRPTELEGMPGTMAWAFVMPRDCISHVTLRHVREIVRCQDLFISRTNIATHRPYVCQVIVILRHLLHCMVYMRHALLNRYPPKKLVRARYNGAKGGGTR